MMIKEIEPELDENGIIKPKQKACATCRKRQICEDFLKIVEKDDNEYAGLVLALYHICDDYESMFIQYPIIVESITTDNAFDYYNEQKNVGRYVIIKLNLENYDEEVHLGLFLGELPTSVISLFDKHDKSIRNKFQRTPAIYIFKFKKMFYGSYQRWKFIENESEFDLISNEDPIAYIELAKTEIEKNNK